MAAVSYDVVREILVRLKDVTTLFRCAAACKGWCSLLVSDDSFLRRCLPEKPCGSPPFSGFFTQLRSPAGPPAPCFVPAPCSVLGPCLRFLSSFFPSAGHAGLFDHAVPLTSRHGLLLVRLDLHRAGFNTGVLLAVCDPVAGMVHELPRLEHSWDFERPDRVGGYALLTDSDCLSSDSDGDGMQQRTRFFKVLMVTIEKSQVRYILHTFSSGDESGWNTCSGVVKDDEDKGVFAMPRQHDAVVCDGAARWLLWGKKTGLHTLDVSCKTGHVSLTNMNGVEIHDFRRHAHDHPYLSIDGEGKLMVLSLQRDGRGLEIWTSRKNRRSFRAWTLRLKNQDQHHVYMFLGEKHGMILVKDNDKRVYIADLKIGVMREVTHWPRSNGLSRRKMAPFEMDWPGFFVSQFSPFAA